MLQALKNLIMPTPTPPTIDTAEIKDICDTYRHILAEEERYYLACAECFAEVAKSNDRLGVLRAELRINPDPAKWLKLAHEASLHDSLFAQNLQSPFEDRRQRLPMRSVRHPEAKDNARKLVAFARQWEAPKLAECQAADAKLTKELDAMDPVVSGSTRKILSLLTTCDLLEEQLSNKFDDDRCELWHPYGSLVAALEEIIK